MNNHNRLRVLFLTLIQSSINFFKNHKEFIKKLIIIICVSVLSFVLNSDTIDKILSTIFNEYVAAVCRVLPMGVMFANVD